jgi:hypothetical protein
VGYRERQSTIPVRILGDMIGTIGRRVLGLTVNCALRNHKFDPIAQDTTRCRPRCSGTWDGLSAGFERQAEGTKKTAEIDAKVALRQRFDRSTSRIGRSWRRKIQEISGQRAAGDRGTGRNTTGALLMGR